MIKFYTCSFNFQNEQEFPGAKCCPKPITSRDRRLSQNMGQRHDRLESQGFEEPTAMIVGDTGGKSLSLLEKATSPLVLDLFHRHF